MSAMISVKYALCTFFLALVAFTCYRHPVPEDFDRYIYEAIVRGKSQPIEVVYNIVKHENPRAEASSILDSPQHLQQLEPFYAIRPLYVELIALLQTFLPIQAGINLISAAALFGIGIVVLLWTKAPVQSALLMAAYPILVLGRMGTPDALAALLAIAGLWLIMEKVNLTIGLCILFLSLGVRTDNVLLLLCVLGCLAWEKRVPLYLSGALGAAAVAIVMGINHWAGNYGWIVLFRCSFVGGCREVTRVPHTLSLREYGSAVVSGSMVIFSHVSFWLLLGILAWLRRPSPVLVITGASVLAHFLLFPSPEDRYLVWGYILAAVVLITALQKRTAAVARSIPLTSA